jgi:hypothetical protein
MTLQCLPNTYFEFRCPLKLALVRIQISMTYSDYLRGMRLQQAAAGLHAFNKQKKL